MHDVDVLDIELESNRSQPNPESVEECHIHFESMWRDVLELSATSKINNPFAIFFPATKLLVSKVGELARHCGGEVASKPDGGDDEAVSEDQ